ncbi:hypothetical protein [Nocardia sp. AB354]|uniref:hypothetical protein n=1 Tax=Nocardia sp. AB354 TaxID=3413283 RepID=UPI003C293073
MLIVEAGKHRRLWLTVVLDDCSRAVPGYTVNLGAPSALNTPLALRQAIWTKSDPAWPMCGIPEMLYVDHGSDFISDHLAQVAADSKFAIVHSAVARPQGRGKVERLFGSINTELLTELPGHLRAGGVGGEEGRRLQKVTKTSKQPVGMRRAIVVRPRPSRSRFPRSRG